MINLFIIILGFILCIMSFNMVYSAKSFDQLRILQIINFLGVVMIVGGLIYNGIMAT